MNRRITRAIAVVLGIASVAALTLVGGASASSDAPGAVYALTNAVTGNAVVVYDRGAGGELAPAGLYPTGGIGSGAGLGSQGSVIVSNDHHLLFAVNAGSNSVSSFVVRPSGLELADVVPSGGSMPTSVAFSRGLLYVLNAGTPNNLSGFVVGRDGDLSPIASSDRPLSAASTSPAQVGFSDDGETVIVSERATNRIDTYVVGSDGLLDGPFVHASVGPVPFGFAVDKRNTLLVSEAGTGGGASSYRIGDEGSLDAISGMVMTGQRAACWTVVTKNGRFGYVTNAGTGNISGFAIGADGSASLLDADGVTAVTGGNPTDAAISHDAKYLYARVAATNRIAIYRVGSDGSLSGLPALDGTPAGLAGLAGF
jgi:6-phosphogluconolactonase (cycloisomerase 2 family)